MLLFKPESKLSMMIMQGDHYMIPRADGLVLVGSTIEDVGFEKGTTTVAENKLHQFAATILPELQGVRPIRHWSGLRPAVAGMEGIPLIGGITQASGLWLNSGHYRNGIVHASGAAKLIVDAIQGRESALQLTLEGQQGFVIPQAPVYLIDNEVI
jgi:glycine oxidase